MLPCLAASYDRPRGLKAADKFLVALPAGGNVAFEAYIYHQHNTCVECEALNDGKNIELNDGKHRYCDT